MVLGEFDLIQEYFASPLEHGDVVIGIGDDCAVVSVPPGKQLAVTTDTLVDGVHFLHDTSPEDIACKAVAVNLSDLAAMGAEPRWLTLALSLPAVDEGWIRTFAESFRSTAGKYNVQLIGGDTTQGPLSITVQAMGLVDPARIMRRDRARPGDSVYVSGTLGDAAAGLRIMQQGQVVDDNQAWLVERLNRPEARTTMGMKLAYSSRCAIDISDGLMADLGHILEASRCGATINIDKVPLSRQLVAYSVNRDEVDWQMVLSGGDDYELCIVVNPVDEAELTMIAAELAVPLTRIGVIEQQPALNVIDDAGARYLFDHDGYEHFSDE
jgi:thiamine-monophosphate kinase